MSEQVYCIRTCLRPSHITWGQEAIKGEIYTLRGRTKKDCLGIIGLLFEEISTESLFPDGSDVGYNEKHFIPIKDSSLDVFRNMFKKPPTKNLIKELIDD